MQLPLYDPLAVIAGIGTVIAMIAAVVQRTLVDRRHQTAAAATYTDADGTPPPAPIHTSWELFPLLLVFWFFTAIIIFSWAGEKMPWLVVHMSLPGNLLAAWCISRLLRVADQYQQHVATRTTMSLKTDADGNPIQLWRPTIWLVPLATFLTVVAVGVALWQFGQPGSGQGAQSSMLQGIVPLLIAGALIYGLLTLATHFSGRVILALVALTFAGVLGAYSVRASWLAVYRHPDTPIELLVYTQTAPDVPRHVADIRALAINLTRNSRTPEDEAGGRSMPIFLDSGSSTGEGSLAWPMQWYLRDFQRLNWTRSDTFQTNPGPQTFEVQMPDGSTALAPVVMLYRPHVTPEVRAALEENYVQPYGSASVFNWWFPEGDKCSPQNAGYKRFYFSTWTPADILDGTNPKGCGRDITQDVHGPFDALLVPFRSANWSWLYQFVIYRDLPYPLVPGAREMEFWLRSDLAGGFGTTAAPTSSTPTLRLVAEQSQIVGSGGSNPTGVATDAQGNLYITATGTHQVFVYSPDGTLIRTLGGFGNEPGRLYEPRGVAVDAAGNIYVADTWNARIAKFDPEGRLLTTWGSGLQDLADGRSATITEGTQAGNEANPLGFFGPRGIAIDEAGNIYIADTGNKRIVVTDTEGNYRYQWGYAGAGLGEFNEPTGVAVDRQGNVYVADTWNGRVQVFAPDGSGQVSPIPIVTWQVSGWQPNTYDDPSIAASPDGQVYVSVPSRQQVLAANLRGDVLLRWGGAGSDLASLNTPSGMAVMPDGSVWVIDRTSERALRFRLPQVQTP
jgi:sugar lactone lactonase YvrE